jgi:hypothetical protein
MLQAPSYCHESDLQTRLDSFRVFCIKHGIPLHCFDMDWHQSDQLLILRSRTYSSLEDPENATCLHSLIYLAREELDVQRICIYDQDRLVWDIPSVILETRQAKTVTKRLKELLQPQDPKTSYNFSQFS